MSPRYKRWSVILFALVGLSVTIAEEAQAIIGMPLTPMSYAGVARRTVRRSAYYGAAYGGYY
jgi:hypothetical protein